MKKNIFDNNISCIFHKLSPAALLLTRMTVTFTIFHIIVLIRKLRQIANRLKNKVSMARLVVSLLVIDLFLHNKTPPCPDSVPKEPYYQQYREWVSLGSDKNSYVWLKKTLLDLMLGENVHCGVLFPLCLHSKYLRHNRSSPYSIQYTLQFAYNLLFTITWCKL